MSNDQGLLSCEFSEILKTMNRWIFAGDHRPVVALLAARGLPLDLRRLFSKSA